MYKGLLPASLLLYLHFVYFLFSCLRNVVSMFHVIEKETQWRKDNNRLEGFDTVKNSKPIVAVGADEPLGGERMKAAYYRTATP